MGIDGSGHSVGIGVSGTIDAGDFVAPAQTAIAISPPA